MALAAIILGLSIYAGLVVLFGMQLQRSRRAQVLGPEPRKDALRREGEGDCTGFTHFAHGGSDTAEMEQRNA